MKIFLCCFIIVLGIACPNLSCANNTALTKNAPLLQQQIPFYSQSQALIFADSLLVEADDDLNDTRRKILPFQQIVYKTVFFVDHHISNNYFKNKWATRYFFSHQSSLFIFLSVFRL